MTTANRITIFRILLVPFFTVEGLSYVGHGKELHRYLPIAASLGASLCDGVDGYIARRYNQLSELGASLDQLRDKLLLLAGIVLLSLHHEQYLPHLPLWLTATVISRDVLLLLGMAVIYYACGKVAVKPHIIGKAATVLQMVAVCWALLKLSASWLHWFAVGAAVCTGVSGAIYLFDGVRQLSASPASSAAPKQ